MYIENTHPLLSVGPGAAVAPHGAHLGDDGDLEAQIVQANLGDVDVVDDNLSLSRLIDPKQAQGQGRLPSSCPPHDANLWDRKGPV